MTIPPEYKWYAVHTVWVDHVPASFPWPASLKHIKCVNYIATTSESRAYSGPGGKFGDLEKIVVLDKLPASLESRDDNKIPMETYKVVGPRSSCVVMASSEDDAIDTAKKQVGKEYGWFSAEPWHFPTRLENIKRDIKGLETKIENNRQGVIHHLAVAEQCREDANKLTLQLEELTQQSLMVDPLEFALD